jgi:hypothetical protein
MIIIAHAIMFIHDISIEHQNIKTSGQISEALREDLHEIVRIAILRHVVSGYFLLEIVVDFG